MGFWAEGVAGKVRLEIKSVSGLSLDASPVETSFDREALHSSWHKWHYQGEGYRLWRCHGGLSA